MSILERILTPPAPSHRDGSGDDEPEGVIEHHRREGDHTSDDHTNGDDAPEAVSAEPRPERHAAPSEHAPSEHELELKRHDPYDHLVLNPPPGMAPVRGMRIRRIRLKSFTKLAIVFWTFGYAATIASLVLLWNVALQLGLITDVEDLLISSLGLDSVSIVGSELFRVVAIGGGLIALLGLIVSVLLAIVYNAACTLFGGLAIETGPLRRRNLPVS